MNYCCSQCDFTSQFENSLKMHHQLHHESGRESQKVPVTIMDPHVLNSSNASEASPIHSFLFEKQKKPFKLSRPSSATRLFGKIRAKMTRSRTLLSHPEENTDLSINDLSIPDDGTSKALHSPGRSYMAIKEFDRETFGCHLCPFEADRITVLDRHLLNDHKIGLDNLLKLVMAKTRDGLSEDEPKFFGIRTPYYKPIDNVIEDGEFVIETVAPKIKILKHTASNTDLIWTKLPESQESRCFNKELEKLDLCSSEKTENDELLSKMQTLNEYMCKFVDSSNTIKKVLNQKLDSKSSRDMKHDGPMFDLGLGDRDTHREWERAHSEQTDRIRSRCLESSRNDKLKISSDSLYF